MPWSHIATAVLAVSIAALAMPTVAVDLEVFEAAYKEWSAEQRKVFQAYGSDPASQAPPVTVAPLTGKLRGTAHPPAISRKRRQASVNSIFNVADSEESSSSSSSDGDDESDSRSQGRHGTSAPAPFAGPLRSFTAVCGKQSELLCDEPNPFRASFCLIGRKESLSKSCAEYVTAKVNCFMSARKMCPDAKDSHLECLFAHRRDRLQLPATCSKTVFYDYVVAGPTDEDLENEKDANAAIKNAV
jgi:hypothetical protein